MTHSHLLTAYCSLLTAHYSLHSIHIWPQDFGDDDGAVRLLIVFEDGNPCPTDSEAGAVDRVDVFGLRAASATETNLRAARLERFIIRAGRDFAERVLRRQPDLYVISLGRA